MNLHGFFGKKSRAKDDQPDHCRPTKVSNEDLLTAIWQVKDKIMSAIGDYAAKVNAAFDNIDASCTALLTSVNGVADDVIYLKEVIDKLQNNPGPISPEDQALLDGAQARADAAASKLSGVKDALAAVDAATERPPTPA